MEPTHREQIKSKWRRRLTVVGVVLGVALLTGAVDFNLVRAGMRPFFCLQVGTYRDGGTKVFVGAGYTLKDYRQLYTRMGPSLQYWFWPWPIESITEEQKVGPQPQVRPVP